MVDAGGNKYEYGYTARNATRKPTRARRLRGVCAATSRGPLVASAPAAGHPGTDRPEREGPQCRRPIPDGAQNPYFGGGGVPSDLNLPASMAAGLLGGLQDLVNIYQGFLNQILDPKNPVVHDVDPPVPFPLLPAQASVWDDCGGGVLRDDFNGGTRRTGNSSRSTSAGSTAPRYRKTCSNNFHHVYADGKYAYDPRLSMNAIPWGDYVRK
ncbi:hypothetical protein OHS18_41410 [Amycolatopsis sp. NBC_00355]|uniref:hypothetical protein n=1 Tax=Amycolatopsis sp. NBC_00355 TaxID=2975957 RepID=UPI002E255F0D